MREGDKLYNESIQYLQENDKFENRMLTQAEVISKYVLFNKRANFAIEECYVTGILNAKSDEIGDLGKVSKNIKI